MPAFTSLHLFFVALFGVLAVIWALVRILQPTALHGAMDTVGRGARGFVDGAGAHAGCVPDGGTAGGPCLCTKVKGLASFA
ncbi:hypothetical protein ACQKGO_33775 [Corallococcus interemptor]|uniref:hypothetical protein n=1 Tax=Corallococcus interemptor TaxID=2316720 RepID=UPI003D00DEB9